MNLIFRKAQTDDIKEIVEIIQQAQEYFAAHDIPQWQQGYPNRDTVAQDIQAGCSYVAEQNGTVVCTAMMFVGREETYDKIYNGSWQDAQVYGVVHRVAVNAKLKGKNVAADMMRFLEAEAKKQGAQTVRIDTHRKNVAMQRMLTKTGYEEKGIIYLLPSCKDEDKERIAFEKTVQ